MAAILVFQIIESSFIWEVRTVLFLLYKPLFVVIPDSGSKDIQTNVHSSSFQVSFKPHQKDTLSPGLQGNSPLEPS